MEPLLRAVSETSENVDVPPMPIRKPLRTWAGQGTGTTCNGCGGSIGPHQIEYEVEMPQGSNAPSLHFHLACYRDWTAARGIR
jgi:hypothetical protein